MTTKNKENLLKKLDILNRYVTYETTYFKSLGTGWDLDDSNCITCIRNIILTDTFHMEELEELLQDANAVWKLVR